MAHIITSISIYVSYKLYLVFVEIKNASIKNKTIFIEEFNKKGYQNHHYTKANYNKIKEWTESKYPKIEFIKSQDLLYSSELFKNSKSSKEYQNALKYKEQIKKIYQEIEFDTLRECFKKIIQIEKFIDNGIIKDDVFENNKQLFKSMSNDSFFSKKIKNISISLFMSFVITILLIIYNIFILMNFL